MYLKRIELQGFKSFADKTVIEVHPGITAIVGPNGSGKSNISDAIRWVMGEQSAKTLRGGKMEDVIFAGTQKRKALGFAEVSLVLDNSSGFLPCEFNEVCVTRRVFRSGESEYLLNRSACRLKDIYELFLDTGIGRDGYSIVGQGKIAEILSAKSDERRQVFEEAAGISKYRYRKNEAERKMGHTEDNLSRVRDILSELTERVEPLRRQSEKAMKYLDLREELKGIEVSALLTVIDTRREQLVETEQQLETAARDFETAKAKFDEYQEKSDALYASIRERDDELEELQTNIAAAEAEAARLISEKAIIENNIENYRNNSLRIEGEMAAQNQRLADLTESDAALRDDEARQVEACAALEAELETLEAASHAAALEMEEKNAALEAVRNEKAALQTKHTDAQSRLDSMKLLADNMESRRFSIEVDRTAAKNEAAELGSTVQQLRTQSEAATAEVERVQGKLFAANQAMLQAERSAQELKKESNAMTTTLGEKQGRLKMLSDMEKALEGYARSVRDLLRDRECGVYTGNLIGVLSKLIQTDQPHVTAIEVALGGAMQNVVVEREDDAKEAIAYLKQKHLGRVTFLPLSAQEGRRLDQEKAVAKSQGFVAIASDLVTREARLDNVIEGLLGRTVVMDTMDHAVALAKSTHYKFKIVTLGGEVLQPGGSITGGSVNRSQALLGRGKEIDALRQECAELEKQAEKIEDAIDAAMDAADHSRAEEETLRSALSEAEARAARAAADLELKNSMLAMTLERQAKLDIEQQQLEEQRTNSAETEKRLLAVLSGAAEEMDAAEQAVRDAQHTLQAFITARDEVQTHLMQKKMEWNGAQKDLDLLRERREALAQQVAQIEGEIADKQALRNAQEESMARLGEEQQRSAKRIAESEAMAAEIKELRATRLLGKSGSDGELTAIREEMRGMSDTILALQEECVRVETKKNKLNYDVEQATNRLWEDYELTYHTALPSRQTIASLSESQKRISQLKNEMKSLGNINVDAIEEYKEVRERYEFMTTQVTDLEKAKSDLEKLIAEMVSVMRVQFAEKFKIINEHFHRIFVDLFGGGRAEVRLSDPSDVLESGIEIEVQPPGKKLQSITLFSGGEHALTAIALLFALLRVSPSPFLVLDEIEAALDDENVYRFADYVKNYGDNTQFVIITHRRGTMESADILYGVTMQERGVSKLLSMNLSDVAIEE